LATDKHHCPCLLPCPPPPKANPLPGYLLFVFVRRAIGAINHHHHRIQYHVSISPALSLSIHPHHLPLLPWRPR
jgi:hypothetical protein